LPILSDEFCFFLLSFIRRNLPVLFTNKEWGTVEFESDGCSGTLDEVNYLEHVEVIVSIEYPVRGQLEIDLISPSGQPKFVKKSIA
jgi:subtilisin-like proprotein convertase family protein